MQSWGFPGVSDGKESARNAGDSGLISGLGRSLGDEKGYPLWGGFPGSSPGKQSTFNAGDPCSIPGSGRSPGGGIGCLFQYSWASLVSQMVKNPAAIQETWVRSLGWEGPVEEGMATNPSILAWRFPWTEGPGGLQSIMSQSQIKQRLTLSLSCRPNRSDVQNKGNGLLCPHFLPCSPPPTISGFARGLG